MKTSSRTGHLFVILSALLFGTSFAAPDFDLFNNAQTFEFFSGDTSPTALKGTDWGDVDTAGGSSTRFFVIKNNGTTNLTIAGGSNTNAANFTLAGLPTSIQPIAPGGIDYFQVTFHPSSFGQKNATVSITSSDPNDNPFTFAITANSVGFPEIVIEGRFDSGSEWVNIVDGDATPFTDDGTFWPNFVAAGATETHTFKVRNTGDVTLTTLSSDDSPHFSISGLPSSIVPGGSSTFSVTFRPQDLGTHIATISISNNDRNEGLFTFAVQGVGQAPRMVVNGGQSFINTIFSGDITPRTQDGTAFGNQHIDNGAISNDFRIRNTGDLLLDLPSATIVGPDRNHFSVTGVIGSLAPNGTDVFTVSFNPTSSGVKQASVSIASNAPNENPYTFAISGSGTGIPRIAMEGSPDGVNFKEIDAGDTSPDLIDGTIYGSVNLGATRTHLFRVSNPGTDTLTLAGSVNGGGFSIFGLAASLEPGQSDEFEVRFSPFSDGIRNGTITVTSNAANNSTFSFAVTAVGLAPEIELFGGDSLSSLISDNDTIPSVSDGTDFGSVELVLGEKTNTFKIRNAGGLGLNVDSVAVSGGSSAPDFTLTNVTTGKLGPSEMSTFQLTFNPSGLGVRTATITIQNNDPNEDSFTFAVTGTGVALPITELRGMEDGQDFVTIANGSSSPMITNGTLFADTSFGSFESNSFRLRNRGSAALNYSFSSSDPQFEIRSGLSSLPPQSSTIFSIRFTPTAAGLQTATITYDSNAPEDDPYTFVVQGLALAGEIQVSGKGINIGNGDSSPRTSDGTDFGVVLTSSTAITRTYQIQNQGNDPLLLGAASLSGNTADFTLAPVVVNTLSIGAVTDLSLTFDPASVGGRTVVVSIPSNDPSNDPFTFTVTGEGTNVMTGLPDLEVSGNGIGIASGDFSPNLADGTDFGRILQGSAPVSVSFAMKNLGTLIGSPIGTVVDVSSISVSSNHPDVAFDSVATGLRSGQSDAFTISFSPTTQGLHFATVSISSTDPNENPYTFAIQLQVDPASAASPIILESVFDFAGGPSLVEFATKVGKLYEVKSSTTLVDGTWTLVPGTIGMMGTGNAETFTFTIALTGSTPAAFKRFYRIEESDAP